MEKHVLITRFDPTRAARGDMLAIYDVLEILSLPLIGIVPESQSVLKASNIGMPVVLADPSSDSARAYADAARRIKGESVDLAVPTVRRSLFGGLFRRAA